MAHFDEAKNLMTTLKFKCQKKMKKKKKKKKIKTKIERREQKRTKIFFKHQKEGFN